MIAQKKDDAAARDATPPAHPTTDEKPFNSLTNSTSTASSPVETDAATPDAGTVNTAASDAPGRIKIVKLAKGAKNPVTSNWQLNPIDANSDDGKLLLERVRKGLLNYGIHAGASGMLIVDIDPKNGGDPEKYFATWPPTKTIRTPSGGFHLQYLWPGSREMSGQRKPEKGVDFIVGMSQAVGPGSVVGGKPYEVVRDLPMADAPAFGIAMCLSAPESKAKDAGLRSDEGANEDIRDSIPNGDHDAFLVSAAASLRVNWGLSEATLRKVIPGLLPALADTDAARPYTEADFTRLAHSAAKLEPGSLDDELKQSTRRGKHSLRVVSAKDAQMVRPEFLEMYRIPKRTLTICEGLGDIGKTTVNLAMIARATVGRSLFDDTIREPMNAIIVAEEDDLGVLRGKLIVAGADLERIKFVDASILNNDVASVRLPRDLPALHGLIDEFKASIVYIDALFSHLELQGEGKMPQQMRAAIAPIARLARETGAAFLAVRHWTKGAKSAGDRGLGSVELANVARSVLSFGRHPDAEESEGRFVIAVSKSNWSVRAPSIEYALESATIDDDNGEAWSLPRVVLLGVAEGVTADDLAMFVPRSAAERNKLLEAKEAITGALADGPLSAAALAEAVRNDGDISTKTFERARKELHTDGSIRREGGGKAGPVMWSLIPIDRQTSSLIATSENGDQCRDLAINGNADTQTVAATSPSAAERRPNRVVPIRAKHGVSTRVYGLVPMDSIVDNSHWSERPRRKMRR